MSSQAVASIVSAPGPIKGNTHNSSLNFQFLELPASGNLTLSVTDNPNGPLTFSLWHVKGGLPDKVVATGLQSGSTVAVSKVELGANYYIGDPSNAGGQTFVVTFAGQM